MKLGFFWDFRNPPQWQRPWADHTAQVLDCIVESERLGADAAWFSEHHLFEDGYLAQPFVFAGAVAARTTRLRLGTAVLLGPVRHARHIAEEAAMVDLISNGRVDLGIGAGYVHNEFDAFGVDRDQRFVLTDATITEVARLFASGEIMPPPVQSPLPLWLGYQTPIGAKRAGRMGFNLLSLDRPTVAAYREGLAQGGHDVAKARVGGVIYVILADDPDKVRHALLPYYAYQNYTYATRRGDPLTYEQTKEKFATIMATKGDLPGLPVRTPGDAVELIRGRVEGLPVEHVYLWGSVAGMPDEIAERHIELTCSIKGQLQ